MLQTAVSKLLTWVMPQIREPTVKESILTEMSWFFSAIHHFHMDYNEARLSPRIFRNHCL